MNERIKLLALQACAFADIQYNKQTKATFYTNKSVEEFFREKFAELIVKECAKSLWTEECYNSDLALEEFEKNSKKILEHFGVEE